MNITEILNANWFWALWGVFGAFMITKLKKVPFGFDTLTLYFGLTAFLISFVFKVNVLAILFEHVQGMSIAGIIWLFFFIILFLITLRALTQYKWLKPILFVIQMFLLGLIVNSIILMLGLNI